MRERYPAAAGGRPDCFLSGAFRQSLNCCYSGVRSIRILVQRYCSAGGIPQCADSLPKKAVALFSVPELAFQNALRKSRAVLMAYCCRKALPLLNPRGIWHLPDCSPLCRPSGVLSSCARPQTASSPENCLHRNSHALVAESP